MLQCCMLGVRHVVEVGTLGGHTAIWCAAGSTDIKVTTIEMTRSTLLLHVRICKPPVELTGQRSFLAEQKKCYRN